MTLNAITNYDNINHDNTTHDNTIYKRTNLVSDIPGVANFTDPNLVNPWGISLSPALLHQQSQAHSCSDNRDGLWVVSDNGTGLATIYDSRGMVALGVKITIPSPLLGGTSAPTGNIFVIGDGFSIPDSQLKASILFATEDGTVAAYNSKYNIDHAVLVINNSATGAVYKGLTVIGQHLYLANFNAGLVEVYNNNYKLIKTFTDVTIPPVTIGGSNYAPFNVKNINNKLYVSFALQDAEKHDDVAGPGHGFVSVFSADGTFLKRLISHGPLNSPWALVTVPNSGNNDNDNDNHSCLCPGIPIDRKGEILLVGNFGDGAINMFSLEHGTFLGPLETKFGPAVVQGLWGLAFERRTLFFAAGIVQESHGLFGRFDPISPKKFHC